MTVMETVVVEDVSRTGLPERRTTEQVAVMTEMYFLTALGAARSRSRCQGRFPVRALPGLQRVPS